MKSVLLTMTLSGSVLFLIFYMVYCLYGSRLKAKWKRYILLLTMVYYLAPFPSLKYLVNGWLGRHRLPRLFPKKLTTGVIDKSDIVYVIDGKVHWEYTQPLLMWGGIICVIVSTIFGLYFVYCRWSFGKKMRAFKRQPVSEECRLIFERALRKLAIRRSISLYKSTDVSAPVTTGIFKPCIWLPAEADAISESELEGVLTHELAHIKHFDLLLYFAGFLVVIIHWFNPFAYLLLHYIRITSEEYSDETAVEHMNWAERVSYYGTMIELACEDVNRTRLGLSFSGRSQKHIKKRIDFIMMEKKKSIWIACIAGVLGIVSGTVTAFAYDMPQHMQLENTVDVKQLTGEGFFPGTPEIEAEILLYDDFFTDTAGNIYPAVEGQTRAECRHQYELGTKTIHILDGKGGCTVYYYHAKRCTVCGNTVYGELYDYVTRKVCPH